MDLQLNGDDFFDRWHEDGDEAFRILCDGFEVPPSCEVFAHGLEEVRTRTRAPITVQQHARTLCSFTQS